MLAPSHMVCGLGMVVLTGRTTGYVPTPPELLLFMIGCLAPDIDGDGTITRPGRLFLPFVGRYLSKLIDVFTSVLGAIARTLARHRGFFHWPIVPILMFALAWRYDSPSMLWFSFGYFTHILCDALTMQGIPVFAPLSWRGYSFGMMRTGSMQETIFSALVTLGIICFGFVLLPQSVQTAVSQLLEHYRNLHR